MPVPNGGNGGLFLLRPNQDIARYSGGAPISYRPGIPGLKSALLSQRRQGGRLLGHQAQRRSPSAQ